MAPLKKLFQVVEDVTECETNEQGAPRNSVHVLAQHLWGS